MTTNRSQLAKPHPADPGDAATHDERWDAFVAENPLSTYLQSSGWARVKAPNGWTSVRVLTATSDGSRVGAQVLLRRPRGIPWSFGYAPRGPLAERWDGAAVEAWTNGLRDTRWPGRVAHVRIDPEVEAGSPIDAAGSLRASLCAHGWHPAPEVQPQVTRIIDLHADEAALWGAMRKKWRQYVNRARSAGIVVVDVDGSRLDDFHALMAETARRAGTRIRAESAYRDIWEAFAPSGAARLLFALGPDGDPQAALFVVRSGDRVVEPYGGMTAAGAESRANYLVKWEAIRTSRGAGAVSYDMWGLVHPGIRQFKEGFGGREVTFIGAWDLPLDRLGHAVYRTGEVMTGRAGRRRPAEVDAGNERRRPGGEADQ